MNKVPYSEYMNAENANLYNDPLAPASLLNVRPDARDNDTSSISSKKYSYHFGIDSINLSNLRIEPNVCFVSEDIEVGILQDDEYIELVADYDTGESGSVEFYILDGSDSKDILPIDTKTVLDEKIFFGLRTRFSINNDEPITVKKNGVIVDIPLEQATRSNEEGYTVSYTPIDAHSLNLNNSTIKIKAILRTYNKNAKAPFIKRIGIKKYGRSFLWKDNIIN